MDTSHFELIRFHNQSGVTDCTVSCGSIPLCIRINLNRMCLLERQLHTSRLS